MEYDPTVIDAEIGEFFLEDKVLEDVWQQKKLRRIWLRYRQTAITGTMKLIIYQDK
jgi:hypothetical protein